MKRFYENKKNLKKQAEILRIQNEELEKKRKNKTEFKLKL